MITARQWWGIAAAGGAVLCFAMAASYCTGCNTPARAPLETKLTSYLSDEQVACLIATHVPGPNDSHQAIVIGCEIGEDLTGFALTLLQLADRLHLGDRHDAGAQ
jgi:hypothetical protein